MSRMLWQHQDHYLRKPRGGCFGASAESQALRYSLCCWQDGKHHPLY